MRLPWSHNATLSLSPTRIPAFSKRSVWRHNDTTSAHIVSVRLGLFRLVRLRPTHDHAKRLGLPIV